MSIPQGTGLTSDQVQSFINDGFVKVDDAFSRDLAQDCRNELWADMGLSPNRPETWTEPVVRIGSKSSTPFVAAANTPRLHAAYDTLVGEASTPARAWIGRFALDAAMRRCGGARTAPQVRRRSRPFADFHSARRCRAAPSLTGC
ncbi:MAG: hypothetical protein KDK08_12420 [Rhizobiaceae bacterium]|nr:hypothetical protein [Rhizobiaceae bacterium]